MYAGSEVPGGLLAEELFDRDPTLSAYCDGCCCDISWSAVNVSRARLGFGSVELRTKELLAGSFGLTRPQSAGQLCERLSSTKQVKGGRLEGGYV